jgi:hypothetical protein
MVTLAIFLLLHIREIDAGRNIYWNRYKDSVCPPLEFYDQTLLPVLTIQARVLDSSVEARSPHC